MADRGAINLSRATVWQYIRSKISATSGRPGPMGVAVVTPERLKDLKHRFQEYHLPDYSLGIDPRDWRAAGVSIVLVGLEETEVLAEHLDAQDRYITELEAEIAVLKAVKP